MEAPTEVSTVSSSTELEAEVNITSQQTSSEFKTEVCTPARPSARTHARMHIPYARTQCLGSTLYLLLLPVFAAPLIILLFGKCVPDSFFFNSVRLLFSMVGRLCGRAERPESPKVATKY